MIDSKTSIFQAISSNQVGSTAANQIESEAVELLDFIDSIKPELESEDIVGQFHHVVSSSKIAATIQTVSNIENIPGAVAQYIKSHNLDKTIALQPIEELVNLDWESIEVKYEANANEQIAVTIGQWGIAETGSIVIQSSHDSPVLHNFLPNHHIILLHQEKILANLEDYAQISNTEASARTTCLITGASGTTDIEGVLVNGAHGPETLHVVIIAPE